MKNRISKVINFFAFNLLFFALYLNFIHQDANVITETKSFSSRLKPALNDNNQKTTSSVDVSDKTFATIN